MDAPSQRRSILAVEGNIGTGKSTTLDGLKKAFQNDSRVVFVDEDVETWNEYHLLDGLYDKSLHNSMFQACALMPQVVKIHEALRNPDVQLVITERSPWSNSAVFAEVNLDPVHMNAYNYLYQGTIGLLAEHTLDISFAFLNVPVDVAAQRMAQRARGSEKDVPHEYLSQLETQHATFLQRIKDRNVPMHKTHTLYEPHIVSPGTKNEVVESIARYANSRLTPTSPSTVTAYPSMHASIVRSV